jgi:hypothetical protein
MTKETNPLGLVGRLAEWHRNRNFSTRELVEILKHTQETMENEWKWGDTTSNKMGCNFPGCNYHRYPASRFCMYHVTGHDTFAARLRRSINKEKKQGIDVSEFEGIYRLVTENIPKPKG